VKTLSIKLKASIAATVSAVLLIALVGDSPDAFRRQDMVRMLSDAQFALVTRVA